MVAAVIVGVTVQLQACLRRVHIIAAAAFKSGMVMQSYRDRTRDLVLVKVMRHCNAVAMAIEVLLCSRYARW